MYNSRMEYGVRKKELSGHRETGPSGLVGKKFGGSGWRLETGWGYHCGEGNKLRRCYPVIGQAGAPYCTEYIEYDDGKSES